METKDPTKIAYEALLHYGAERERFIEEQCALYPADQQSACVEAVRRELQEADSDANQAGAVTPGPPGTVGHEKLPDLSAVGYIINGVIGSGGYGKVYKAEEPGLKRTVAIKMLKRGIFGSATDVLRFKQEMKVQARLNHPGIVKVLFSGYHDKRLYYVMEYVGESLQALIANQRDPPSGKELTPRRIAKIARQIAHALGHAQDHNLIHRDLKPSNVVLDDHLEPRLIDFGLVKDLAESNSLSGSNEHPGTVFYRAPEAASDIYSLGKIIEVMLDPRKLPGGLPQGRREASPAASPGGAGPLAPSSPNPPTPVSASASNAGLPRETWKARKVRKHLQAIAERCTELDTNRRYEKASQVALDLGYLLKGRAPPFASSCWTRWLDRLRRYWVAVGALLIAGVLVLMFVFSGKSPGPDEGPGVDADRGVHEVATALFQAVDDPASEVFPIEAIDALIQREEDLRRSWWPNPARLHDLLLLQFARAKRLHGTHQMDEAGKAYDKAVGSCEQLGTDGSLPREWHRDCARVFHDAAAFKRETGDADGSLDLYEKAIQTWSSDIRANPQEVQAWLHNKRGRDWIPTAVQEHPGDREAWKGLGFSLGCRADLQLVQGSFPEVEKAYEKSRQIRDALHQSDKENAIFRLQLARSHTNSARLALFDPNQTERERLEASLKSWDDALRIDRKLLKESDQWSPGDRSKPSRFELLTDLATSQLDHCTGNAVVLWASGKEKEARDAAEEGRKYCEELGQLKPLFADLKTMIYEYELLRLVTQIPEEPKDAGKFTEDLPSLAVELKKHAQLDSPAISWSNPAPSGIDWSKGMWEKSLYAEVLIWQRNSEKDSNLREKYYIPADAILKRLIQQKTDRAFIYQRNRIPK